MAAVSSQLQCADDPAETAQHLVSAAHGIRESSRGGGGGGGEASRQQTHAEAADAAARSPSPNGSSSSKGTAEVPREGAMGTGRRGRSSANGAAASPAAALGAAAVAASDVLTPTSSRKRKSGSPAPAAIASPCPKSLKAPDAIAVGGEAPLPPPVKGEQDVDGSRRPDSSVTTAPVDEPIKSEAPTGGDARNLLSVPQAWPRLSVDLPQRMCNGELSAGCTVEEGAMSAELH